MPNHPAQHTHPSRRTTTRAIAAAIASAGLALAACSSSPDIGDGPVYPVELRQADVVDVQVIRSGTTITLTNSTATPFAPGRLWINAWYSRNFDGLDVGQTVTLSLREFKDRYGESFRAGGFFSTEPPDKLVLAQIEIDNTLVGLVVIAQDD